jgi:hypothetical protein
MPDLSEDISVEMQEALIKRMLASSAFKGSPGLGGLLWFLFEKREKLLSAKEIDFEYFKRHDKTIDGAHVRERVSELKKRIEKYRIDTPDESIRCVLSDAGNIGGYQIRFERTETASACRRFWTAHLQSDKEVPVVCSPLLFYWDDASGMMFRFMDTNIEGLGKEAALEELRHRHRKHHKENLIPGHLYMDVGSVAAAELVREYFRISKRHVPLILDKHSNLEWLKSSPIIIGNVRNTPSVRKIFGSAAVENLAYRLDEKQYSGITIKNPRKNEIEALASIGVELDGEGGFCAPFTKLTIGFVTRLPNPRGAGVITLISADGTFTTEQLAVALTDEVQLRAVFAGMGWPLDAPVPERFELMFKAELWPAGFDDQATDVEFICGRP